MFDFPWDTATHQQIYDQVHGGPAGALPGNGFVDGGQSWHRLVGRMQRVADAVDAAGSGLAAHWQGRAADAASDAVHPLKPWVDQARGLARAVGSVSHEQAQNLVQVRSEIPAPRPDPAPAGPWWGAVLGGAGPIGNDYQVALAAQVEDERAAQEAMKRYQGFSRLRMEALPRFVGPGGPQIVPVDPRTAGGGSGDRGAGDGGSGGSGGGGTDGGGVPSGGGAPGQVPAGGSAPPPVGGGGGGGGVDGDGGVGGTGAIPPVGGAPDGGAAVPGAPSSTTTAGAAPAAPAAALPGAPAGPPVVPGGGGGAAGPTPTAALPPVGAVPGTGALPGTGAGTSGRVPASTGAGRPGAPVAGGVPGRSAVPGGGSAANVVPGTRLGGTGGGAGGVGEGRLPGAATGPGEGAGRAGSGVGGGTAGSAEPGGGARTGAGGGAGVGEAAAPRVAGPPEAGRAGGVPLVPPVGTAGGQGGGDRRHRPDYLHEDDPDAIAGVLPPTAPPVLGQ